MKLTNTSSSLVGRRTFHGPALALAALTVVFASTSNCWALRLTITANNGSVTGNPGKSYCTVDEVVTLTPKPRTRYCFAGWPGDVQAERLVLNLTMAGDKTIVANFAAWQLPIDVTARS